MINKTCGMYLALGVVSGYGRCDKGYRDFKLSEVFGEQYSRYSLGILQDEIVLYKDASDERKRTRVVEVTMKFTFEQMVQILLNALAFDMKNNKE